MLNKIKEICEASLDTITFDYEIKVDGGLIGIEIKKGNYHFVHINIYKTSISGEITMTIIKSGGSLELEQLNKYELLKLLPQALSII